MFIMYTVGQKRFIKKSTAIRFAKVLAKKSNRAILLSTYKGNNAGLYNHYKDEMIQPKKVTNPGKSIPKDKWIPVSAIRRRGNKIDIRLK